MITDTPMMELDTPVKRLEQRAIDLFRAKCPDAPPWQELHMQTRAMWVAHAEKQEPPNA